MKSSFLNVPDLWFGAVDDLRRITKAKISEAVAKSCCLLLLLTDETLQARGTRLSSFSCSHFNITAIYSLTGACTK